MVNFISWPATRAPSSWPQKLRWRLAQYYHVDGLHVGGALAGTAWYIVSLHFLLQRGLMEKQATTMYP
ncbi:hypothetical protein AAFM46_07050 [Arthrobacter sp. TMP15]|uniref:hypothetical protein n=1 Tax=Arthrobacter sp. TMP15 TaxID=3140789 RepID=UPI0031B9CA5C